LPAEIQFITKLPKLSSTFNTTIYRAYRRHCYLPENHLVAINKVDLF